MRCPVVVDFPESTCPMTTMLICVFSFPMLVGYAGLAVAGRAVGTQLRFWGGCGGRGRRVKRAPVTATSQPIGDGSPPLAPPSRWTTRPIPAGGARPRLAALPALGWSQSAPGGGQPGYFWPPRTASKSQQDATFFSVLPSTALLETPSSQGYVIGASKVPFLPGKPSSGSGLLQLPSRSFQTRGHLLHVVGALGGAVGARPCRLPSPLPSRARFG